MDIGLILFRSMLVLATAIWVVKLVLELVGGLRDYHRRRDDIQAPVDASMRRWSYLADRRS